MGPKAGKKKNLCGLRNEAISSPIRKIRLIRGCYSVTRYLRLEKFDQFNHTTGHYGQ